MDKDMRGEQAIGTQQHPILEQHCVIYLIFS